MDAFQGYSRSPDDRISGCIQIVRSSTRQPNYDVVNANIAASIQRLNTFDQSVRFAANWLPGGALGVAIADIRANPGDSDNLRRLAGGLAATAIDLIPIPGLRAAGNAISRVGGKATGYVAHQGASNVGKAAIGREADSQLDRTLGPITPDAAGGADSQAPGTTPPVPGTVSQPAATPKPSSANRAPTTTATPVPNRVSPDAAIAAPAPARTSQAPRNTAALPSSPPPPTGVDPFASGAIRFAQPTPGYPAAGAPATYSIFPTPSP